VGHQEKIRLIISIAVGILLATTASFAQDGITVKGLVADSATHRPISFVNIIIKHTSRGTTTDRNGYFTLIAQTSDTLLFSFIGYRTLEFPARDWEPSVIMMAEVATVLNTLTVEAAPLGDPYEHLFDEENIRLKNSKRAIPFYYPKDKKEKILLGRAKQEQERVQHYVDLLVKDDKVKNELMKKHKLTDDEYYDILAKFNQKNYAIMYYLSDSELLSLLFRFYEVNAER
jgi:hypothetical protein